MLSILNCSSREATKEGRGDLIGWKMTMMRRRQWWLLLRLWSYTLPKPVLSTVNWRSLNQSNHQPVVKKSGFVCFFLQFPLPHSPFLLWCYSWITAPHHKSDTAAAQWLTTFCYRLKVRLVGKLVWNSVDIFLFVQLYGEKCSKVIK